jgi:hypothetical protein
MKRLERVGDSLATLGIWIALSLWLDLKLDYLFAGLCVGVGLSLVLFSIVNEIRNEANEGNQ